MGRNLKGVWGGRESGAAREGSMGRKGAWGGREHGADGSLGRKGVLLVLVWGGREGSSRGDP